MQKPFEQNIIALIWDFDKTLAKDYMQKPIFNKYGVDEQEFWKENNSLVKKYKDMGIKVSKDTIYLNHLLTCVDQGILEGLNNSLLRELGQEIKFYEGIPDFFQSVKNLIEEDERYKKYHITVEHYIVSTGLAEMIKGSAIFPFVDGIWGCEFIEEPIKSKLVENEQIEEKPVTKSKIKQIAYVIDNTTKTRAVFEINKGVNKYPDMDVNAKFPLNARRIPFSNMIYIADGPSDVPVFSVLKQNGGKTFAVYPTGSIQHLRQVDKLRAENRIDMYGEANYREGTLTNLWLSEQVKIIANKIYSEKEEAIKQSLSSVPDHII